MPLDAVTPVTVAEVPNLPLAPLAGAAKVTVAPLIGLLLASLTVAWRAVANTVLTLALCGVPAVAVITDGGPGLFVKLKMPGFAAPAALAVIE
jgi:hypothetical protein